MTDDERPLGIRLRKRVALIDTGETTDDGKPILRERVRLVRVDEPRARQARRCPVCGGTGGELGLCPGCFAYGWVWDDGVPPTPCSEKPEPGSWPLPCGRRGAFCPGCGRKPGEIPAEADLERAVLMRIGDVLMAGPKLWAELTEGGADLDANQIAGVVRRKLRRPT